MVGPASIALATPILMPHTIVGRSLFDQTQDLQQLGSVLTRGLLDNLYIVNRPRPVISDQVNLDSLIDWVPGSPIRLKPGARPGDNHVAWLQVPNVTGAVLSALEHLATVRENRTGVSRYNQGLDAESLNKTLGGLDRIMSAASQRQDLIARTFAETAIKRLYRLIYRAIKRAATGPVAYWPQMGGAFASCDPSQWPDDMELSVDVVGIGNREQTIGHLALVGSLQEKLIAFQGGKAEGPFVTAENIANGAQKLTETLGYKTPGLFFQPADKVVNTASPAPPPAAAGAEPRAARGAGADRDPAPSGGGRHADQAREGAGRHRHRRVQGAAMGGDRALQGRPEGEPSGRCRARPRDSVMTDDNEQRYRRAREVLADAGWLFDDFVNNEMRRVLTSDPDDMTTREIAYNRARVATEVKAALSSLVDEYEADIQLKERREQLKESLYGRRN